MWHELYEKLTNSEKEEFKRILNMLLSRTYIIRDIFDTRESMMKINPEYRFIERNYELFLDYLSFGGWKLEKDSNYGVLALSNVYEYNKLRLDRMTTLILFILRLIFEEEREKVTLRNEILTTTGQVVHKMIALGLVKKKPSDRDLIDGLRQLSHHNIIEKIEGAWEAAETKLLILPSILFVVTNEKISRMHEMIGADESTDEAPAEIDSADVAEIIRGDDI